MTVTIFNLGSTPRSGKSMIARGAALEFMKMNPGELAFYLFKDQNEARGFEKYHKSDFPGHAVHYSSANDWQSILATHNPRFLVVENLNWWSVAKYKEYEAFRERMQEGSVHLPETPITIIEIF